MKDRLKFETQRLSKKAEKLKRLWVEYVKKEREVSLDRSHITLAEGCSERMDKMVYEDGDVLLIDQFGNRYSLLADCGIETLQELHDVVLVAGKSSAEK